MKEGIVRVKIPQELEYSLDHEWIRVEDNRATIGITDFAQSQLGDILFVEVPTIGEITAVGNTFAVIESVKAVSYIYAPVSGVIVAVNTALTDAPEVVNQDPYGQGWIVVIEMTDRRQLTQLLNSTEYEKITVERASKDGLA